MGCYSGKIESVEKEIAKDAAKIEKAIVKDAMKVEKVVVKDAVRLEKGVVAGVESDAVKNIESGVGQMLIGCADGADEAASIESTALRKDNADEAASIDFKVLLQKDTLDAALGMSLGICPTYLVVQGISSDGLIAAWNTANASSSTKVQAGDQINSVNNITGNAEQMLGVFNSQEMQLSLSISRKPWVLIAPTAGRANVFITFTPKSAPTASPGTQEAGENPVTMGKPQQQLPDTDDTMMALESSLPATSQAELMNSKWREKS